MAEERMTTGERIRQSRKQAHMSAETLARRCGLSPATIYRYENGKISKISSEQLSNIAEALDTPLSYLLGLDDELPPLPPDAYPIDPSEYHKIPILGRIAAGLPIYAEENLEGYTLTDLNEGAEYFALRVRGDSMNAARLHDGDLIIVRRQSEVEDGEIAVVLVDDEDATVKRFYHSKNTVTLMPQSYNPKHKPQIYSLAHTSIRVLGKVVKAETFF